MICNVCKESFSTRNKLFTHIKEKNHALRVESQPVRVEESSGKKKGKNKKGKR